MASISNGTKSGNGAGPQLDGQVSRVIQCLLNRILKYRTEYTCGMSSTYYDVAQVCLSGHVINDRARGRSEHNKKYCDKCGEKTITSCQDCGKNIRGDMAESPVYTDYTAPAPNYCIECGKSYPWTQRKYEAFRELVNSSSQNQDYKTVLLDGITHIMHDTPETEVACVKFSKIIPKLKQYKQPLVSSLSNIATDSAKELLVGLGIGVITA